MSFSRNPQDLLWVSNLQADEITTEGALIKLRSLQRVNRIALYLALGGGFDTGTHTEYAQRDLNVGGIIQLPRPGSRPEWMSCAKSTEMP